MSLAPAVDIREAPLTSEPEEAVLSAGGINESSNAGKGKKRSLFNFGKKKSEDKKTAAVASSTAATSAATITAATSSPQQQQQQQQQQHPTSPPAGSHTHMEIMQPPHVVSSCPSPGRVRSSSPRLASPARSCIFERDVQESAVMPNSPAIPAHIQVENYIPPALDATSEAITDAHLNPDSVEIITHASHQPAAVTVTGTGTGPGTSPYETTPLAYETGSNAGWLDELQALADKEEATSNYGSLDSADVRRLSFISFADVVQAEHSGTSHPALYPNSTSFSSAANRSPSPIRSPISSQGAETSSPASKSGSITGFDLSISPRLQHGSPGSMHHHSHSPVLSKQGDAGINVETMTQALRRTGSSDLGGARSLPVSPVEGPVSR